MEDPYNTIREMLTYYSIPPHHQTKENIDRWLEIAPALAFKQGQSLKQMDAEFHRRIAKFPKS